MKTVLLCILLTLSGIISAQTIDNPSFKARTGSLCTITRIERTPENTRVYIHAIFRPHWWIKITDKLYLEDATTEDKYKLISLEGIEANKQVYMPDSGEMDFVLIFEPLPKTTKVIHFLSPSANSEINIYDISLETPKKNQISPLESIKGNWYKTDIPDHWAYGVYDSITIIHNMIFKNADIRKKGKKIELALKDRRSDTPVGTLLFTPGKDGKYTIQNDKNDKSKYEYTRQKNTADINLIIPEKDFKPFFREDSTCIQGYINGYDPRLGFDTGIIYLQNIINHEDYPTVVAIHPDGSFSAKFPLYYPIEDGILFNGVSFPFVALPGQTTTIYIDWEDVMARIRARDSSYPINPEYMGPASTLCKVYKYLDETISYPYSKLSKAQKELTPNQFKENVKTTFAQWDQIGDSLSHVYSNSDKAVHLIKNKISIMKGQILLDFLMSRDFYAMQDKANQALQVKEDDSYYNFLKDIDLNDETLLADSRTDIFINRFEYMTPLSKAIFGRTETPDSIECRYATKSLLTYLKENGVKLTPEQEKLRIKEEERAGKTMKVKYQEMMFDLGLVMELYKQEKKLVREHQEKYLLSATDDDEPVAKSSEEDENKVRIQEAEKRWIKGDSVVCALSGQSRSFLWQVTLIRSLKSSLRNYPNRKAAQAYIDTQRKFLTHPVLIAEAERIFNVAFPKTATPTYQLPEGKATEIFRNIIKNHPGKVLFVDFWATSCGPCRQGIEATANLRAKYKNHPEFQFIYITGEGDSPKNAYNQYVEKHLKGEASYYVSDTEFNYLRQLFKFNGIPHYELIEKDGSVSTKNISAWELSDFLEERFETSK